MAIAAVAAMFTACDKTPEQEGEFTETAPEFTSEVSDIVVTEETLDNKLTFTCSPADFGVSTQINYSLEVQIGEEGLKSVVATSTTTTIETTLEKLNYELYVKLGITIGEPVDVNFYISAQMGESAKLYSQPKTAKVTAIEAGPMKSEWGLVGTVNGWGFPDITMFIVEPYFVAYNVVLTETDEFKIRASVAGEWDDTKNYGTEVKGTFAPNVIIPVVTSGGSQNIGVKEAGVYDIYFDLENTTVYLMQAGKTPDQAGEAETEYVDGSTLVVGLSGKFAGVEYWVDPADDRLAAFKTKTITDEATHAGTYTYEIANFTMTSGDEFKVRINGAWIGVAEGATVEGLAVSGEGNFIAGESGTYKVAISFDWDGLTQTNVKATFSK